MKYRYRFGLIALLIVAFVLPVVAASPVSPVASQGDSVSVTWWGSQKPPQPYH